MLKLFTSVFIFRDINIANVSVSSKFSSEGLRIGPVWEIIDFERDHSGNIRRRSSCHDPQPSPWNVTLNITGSRLRTTLEENFFPVAPESASQRMAGFSSQRTSPLSPRQKSKERYKNKVQKVLNFLFYRFSAGIFGLTSFFWIRSS